MDTDQPIVAAESPPAEVIEQAIEAPEEGASSVSEPVEDTRPEWAKFLDEAPADEIRKHPKFAGIVGSEKQRWTQEQAAAQEAQRAANEAAQRAKALEDAQNELDELYNKNPLEYADKKFTEDQIKRAQDRIKGLQVDARKAVAQQVGSAFHDIPEWQEIVNDPASFSRLTAAIQGVPEDLVIPAWNATATELIAEKRAESKAEARLEERITQERTAWETEMAANGFIASDRPQLLRGRGVANLDPEPNWRTQPKEWDSWYARNERRAG